MSDNAIAVFWLYKTNDIDSSIRNMLRCLSRTSQGIHIPILPPMMAALWQKYSLNHQNAAETPLMPTFSFPCEYWL